MRASDIDFRGVGGLGVTERRFLEMGDRGYRFELLPAGVVFEADRMRREHHQLTGELRVMVPPSRFPDAKVLESGIISWGEMNFSAVQTRTGRAKILAQRSGIDSLDWYGFLEDFAVRIMQAERKGKPAVVLADEVADEENAEQWDVGTFPVLQHLPMVLFGSAAGGKSYFAMWLAGTLARQGVPVLYADWEFAVGEHRKRLSRLFQPMPKALYYVRCERPLKAEADRLARLIVEHQIQYIVCDSVGFAVEGPAESQEGASGYFQALRHLKVGSLNIAHVPKQYDDAKEAQIFGSIFWQNGARSTWFIERATENPSGELRFGLYQRKNNLGEKLAPQAYKLIFRSQTTSLERIDVSSVDELAAQMPLIDRLRRSLKGGAEVPKTLAEDLGVSYEAVRKTLARHPSVFVKVGKKVGLKSDVMEF